MLGSVRTNRISDSPGFIGREWIETLVALGTEAELKILPALLVGSGLKPRSRHKLIFASRILPALLVGSGLKHVESASLSIEDSFSRLYWSGVD